MSDTTFRNKNLVRPRKSAKDRIRRQKVHRQRLIALGVTEDEVNRMDPTDVRRMLRHPKKVAARVAKAKA
jgi:hypothetical protein